VISQLQGIIWSVKEKKLMKRIQQWLDKLFCICDNFLHASVLELLKTKFMKLRIELNKLQMSVLQSMGRLDQE